jgi:hypothetical protein
LACASPPVSASKGAAPAAAIRTVRRLTPDLMQVSRMSASYVDEIIS